MVGHPGRRGIEAFVRIDVATAAFPSEPNRDCSVDTELVGRLSRREGILDIVSDALWYVLFRGPWCCRLSLSGTHCILRYPGCINVLESVSLVCLSAGLLPLVLAV